MGWSNARCKCGDNLTRYSSGWKHHETYSNQCPDGSEAEPVEEVIEVTRFLTRPQYEAFLISEGSKPA